MSNKPKIRVEPDIPRVRIVGITPTGDREPYGWETHEDVIHSMMRAILLNQIDREYVELRYEIEAV